MRRNRRNGNGKKKGLSRNQAKAVKQIIKSQIDTIAEEKYVDTVISSGSADRNNWVPLALINGITQGDSDQAQRNGDRIRLKGLQFRYMITPGTDTMAGLSDGENIFRLIIFQWFRNTTPTVSQVLQQASGTLGDVFSAYHHDNMKAGLLSILLDRFHALSNRSSGSHTQPLTAVHGKFFSNLKFQKKNIQFIAGGSAVDMGQIFVLCLSDSALTPNPQISYYSRVTYTDI